MKPNSTSSLLAAIVTSLWLFLGQAAVMGVSLDLQGQSKGSTSWISGNLQDWQELDYIPCRVYVTGGPVNAQSVTISFPHLSGTTPGVQNLFNFAASPNAQITSGPTLAMNGSGTWSYTFQIKVNNSSPAYVQFFARLAAGAHLNPGSSLMLGGNPSSMGNLQIHKPAAGPGAPDLAILKTGPAVTTPGSIITYTMSYTNNAKGTNTAYGTQISDILPYGISVLTNTINGGLISGDTIFWDLGNVAPGAGGQVSFDALVSASAPNGQILVNYAQIKSSENDASDADNSSMVQTVVLISGTVPTIATQPLSQTNCPATPVSFSVYALGSAPLQYQWRRDGNNLLNATNSSYSIASVSALDEGFYDVVVSNACGSVTSCVASLVLNTPVSATALISQTNCPGTTVVFSTVASGTGPFSYAWFKGNSALGETGSSLTLNNVSAENVGVYSVVVSGACGSVTNSASLSVNTPVSATALVSQTNCPGTTVVFSTVASGTGPFSYAWFKGNTALSKTGSSLILNNVSAENVGVYSVVVSGACGSVTNSASLSVNTPVSATALISQTNCPGTTVVFSTVASGTGPFNYAWFKGNAALGETGSSLTLNNVSAENVGVYSVVVSGACGSVTNSASLSVNTPVSATAFISQTNCPGTTVVFSTVASGTGPFSYAWFKGNTALGETGSSLTLNNVSAENVGVYSVVVSGACGLVTNSASLSVNTPVSATALISQTNCPGTTVVFSTVASGTGPFSYAWFKGNSALGETGSSLTLNNVTSENVGVYSVVVSGACGSVTNSASLSVNTPVSATALISQTNCPGTTVVFSTVASGTGPFNYAWFKGNAALGETGSSLSLNNVTSENVGVYSVVVSGACGSVTNSASLSVNTPVSATALISQTNCPGTTIVFSTVASGTGPFSYAWFKGNSALGETGSSVTLNNITSENVGVYSVIVSGACGSVTNSASLSVNTPVSATALINQTNCPGTTVVFSTVASGTGPFNYAWFKGNVALGETGSSLTLNDVSAENIGVYSVVVSGACGSVTNSASLSVNTPVSATALISQTNCPGTTVVFSTVASGTGPFSYAWFKGNAALGETGSSLTLNNVSAENAGIYSIIVNGACGSVTNTAILSVNETTTASPLVNLVRNPGETAVFSTTVSGTGPFTYAWKKNAEWIGGQTQNSLTLTNVGAGDEATYTVEVSGACTSTNYSASLHINVAPTVSISNPTNGAVFAFPASFALTANAQDIDGTVTNVEFFRDDILLGQTADGNPYVLSLTNLVPGTYTFTAKATDNGGLSSTSAPVSITVIDQLPLVLQGALKFNPQTGLYEQKVRVSNPTLSTIEGIRLYIYGLNSSTTVYNATGSTNGVPYVQSLTAIASGGYVDLVIEYHLTTSGTPNPTLVAVIVPANNGGNTTVLGLGVNINRSLMKPDGTFLLEFATQVGGKYFIQYSSDLKTWKTVDAPVDGTGTKVIWLDNGQPKTESLPSAAAMRFYRVIVTP